MTNIEDPHEELAADWARLGVALNASPAQHTPDLEMLLLRTVAAAPKNSRLLILAATWLHCYGDYVAKRRLALLTRTDLCDDDRPVLGLLLDWVRSQGSRHRHRFDEVIVECVTAPVPKPLLELCRHNPILHALARKRASRESLHWGCWMESFEPKLDAIRPAEWVARHNPSLALRALWGGNLVATIAADALAGAADFASESELARRYGASRSAVRDALRKLKLAGVVAQFSRGKVRAGAATGKLPTT